MISSLGLVVAEHDVTKNESIFTYLHTIAAFIIHPDYNIDSTANDIALIRTQNPIIFNEAVQPVCLPFKYRENSFLGQVVTALGW
jgi:Trypsin